MEECTFIYDNNVTIIYNSIKHVEHLSNYVITSHNNLKERVGKEKRFREIITHLINKNIIDKKKNIIDLGAWIGDNALPWAKNIEGIVYAIDPGEDNCKFINETAQYNEINNITTICAAISDKEEQLTTNEPLDHCSFVYNEKCTEIRDTNTVGINSVLSTSLDILHGKGKIENIGFIHLDVEGMEHKVIKGSSALISKYRPIITYENHLELDKHVLDIKSYFIGINYTVRMIDEVLEGCRLDCRNFLAIPNEIYYTIDFGNLI